MITNRVIAERLGFERRSGYWGVNGLYFFNKAECLRYASTIKDTNVKYYFYDSVYRSLNWSIEPSENLNEMYKNRANQLRDKYDYLILCFSGGADSSNILNTFISNNIKLDEVYCEYPITPLEKLKHNFTGNRDDATLLTFEWYTAAKPALEKLAQTNPEIKITVDDVSAAAIKNIENSQLYKWFRAGSSVNPNTMKYYRLYEIARDREKCGRVGCITGLDKPRISYNPTNKSFFSSYSDFNNIFSEFPNDAFSGYQASIEFFYYSYEYPQLNQKQCFVLKNALLELFASKNFSLTFYKDILQSVNEKGIHVYDVHHDFFKKLLYENWNTEIWQAKKSPNFFYPPASQWFYDKNITEEKTRDYYDKQLIELISGIDDYFIIYENGKPASLKHYVSEPIKF